MTESFFDNKRILITGGLGFIGTSVVETLLKESTAQLQIIDNLGVGSNLSFCNSLNPQYGHRFKISPLDLAWTDIVIKTCVEFDPDIILHLAAESHVDRSITSPSTFVSSNVTGTFSILEAARRCYEKLEPPRKEFFRFHHVSTDEVFGSLDKTGSFDEHSAYNPNSPYSATKAASDHLVRAWHHTYGLPVTISNCSNNYGPRQADEKLIPTIIRSVLNNEHVRLYGNGTNVRDWLYVQDHVSAVLACVEHGTAGETYCVGTRCEKTNVDLTFDIFDAFSQVSKKYASNRMSIVFVGDRLGHDFRYSINPTKIETELGWKPEFNYSDAICSTVNWYIERFESER